MESTRNRSGSQTPRHHERPTDTLGGTRDILISRTTSLYTPQSPRQEIEKALTRCEAKALKVLGCTESTRLIKAIEQLQPSPKKSLNPTKTPQVDYVEKVLNELEKKS